MSSRAMASASYRCRRTPSSSKRARINVIRLGDSARTAARPPSRNPEANNGRAVSRSHRRHGSYTEAGVNGSENQGCRETCGAPRCQHEAGIGTRVVRIVEDVPDLATELE